MTSLPPAIIAGVCAVVAYQIGYRRGRKAELEAWKLRKNARWVQQ